MIKVECPSCLQEFHLRDDLAGRKGKCPACHETIEVPAFRMPEIAADVMLVPQEGPSGIWGWLLIPAFGLLVSPLIFLFWVYININLLFSSGCSSGWMILYTSPLRTALIGQSIVGVVFLVFLLYVNHLFWGERRALPLVMIVSLCVNVVLVAALEAWTASIFGSEMEPKGSVCALVLATVWIPYFRRSKRVKNTFVKRRRRPSGAGGGSVPSRVMGTVGLKATVTRQRDTVESLGRPETVVGRRKRTMTDGNERRRATSPAEFAAAAMRRRDDSSPKATVTRQRDTVESLGRPETVVGCRKQTMTDGNERRRATSPEEFAAAAMRRRDDSSPKDHSPGWPPLRDPEFSWQPSSWPEVLTIALLGTMLIFGLCVSAWSTDSAIPSQDDEPWVELEEQYEIQAESSYMRIGGVILSVSSLILIIIVCCCGVRGIFGGR